MVVILRIRQSFNLFLLLHSFSDLFCFLSPKRFFSSPGLESYSTGIFFSVFFLLTLERFYSLPPQYDFWAPLKWSAPAFSLLADQLLLDFPFYFRPFFPFRTGQNAYFGFCPSFFFYPLDLAIPSCLFGQEPCLVVFSSSKSLPPRL